MVSIGPYSKGHDNLHMWDFVDYRPSHNPSICAVKNSLLDYVYNHPRLKKFGAVLKRANLNGQYEQPELDITMFIPYDEFLREPQSFYNNLDVGSSRQILHVSSLNRRISGDLIRSSPVSKYITRDPYNRNIMYVTNISGVTELNNCVNVVDFDINLTNALVHHTTGFLFRTDAIFIN